MTKECILVYSEILRGEVNLGLLWDTLDKLWPLLPLPRSITLPLATLWPYHVRHGIRTEFSGRMQTVMPLVAHLMDVYRSKEQTCTSGRCAWKTMVSTIAWPAMKYLMMKSPHIWWCWVSTRRPTKWSLMGHGVPLWTWQIYMWQSQVEIKYYSVTFFTALTRPKHCSAELLLRAGLIFAM